METDHSDNNFRSVTVQHISNGHVVVRIGDTTYEAELLPTATTKEFNALLAQIIKIDRESNLSRSASLARVPLLEVAPSPVRSDEVALPSSLALDLLLPPILATDAYANLEEYYPLWREKHGRRAARWIFRIQIWWIIVGHRGGAIVRLFERLAKAIKPG